MSFAKPLAKVGLFGLPGLIASGAFKDKKKDNSQKSLVSGSYNSPPTPSLVSNKSIY